MLKSFGLQVRLNDKSHAQFVDHWFNVHAPMSAGINGVRGYVLNEILSVQHSASIASLAIGMTLDGIAQLWFDSREAMMALTQTPEVKRWFSDGPNYMGARTGFATAERVLRAPPGTSPTFKLITFFGRNASLSVEQFRQQWSQAYANAVLGIEGVQGYVQSDITAANLATNMPNVATDEVDGIGEIWVASEADAKRLLAAIDQQTAAIGAGLFGKQSTLVAKETVVIAPTR
ncbi:MAG: EthD family reductase [Steroidobacteraceae bacterium]